MAGSTLECGCAVSPDPSGGMSVDPCAQHQLDTRGLAQMLADSPPANPAQTPAATYSGDPTTSPKDAVRFKLGDTGLFSLVGQTRFFLTDGEISYLLIDGKNSTQDAALQGCYAIMAKAAQMRDESNGSVSISWGQVYSNYVSLLDRLKGSSMARGLPFAGGISRAQKAAQRANPDRVKPSFTRDMMQTPDDPEEPLTETGNPYGSYNGGGNV